MHAFEYQCSHRLQNICVHLHVYADMCVGCYMYVSTCICINYRYVHVLDYSYVFACVYKCVLFVCAHILHVFPVYMRACVCGSSLMVTQRTGSRAGMDRVAGAW